MSSRHGPELHALWERFDHQRHVIATVTRVGGLWYRTLCGLTFPNRSTATDPCGYCPACSREKAAMERRKARRS